MPSKELPPDSPTVEDLLLQGIAAAREKRRGEARRCLQQVLALDPVNEEAWLWLARIATDPRSALSYFSRVLDINPQNQRARDGFVEARAQLRAQLMEQADSPSAAPTTRGESAVSLRPNPRSAVRTPRSAMAGPVRLRLPQVWKSTASVLTSPLGRILLFGLIGLALLALVLVASGRATELGQAAWTQWIATSTPTPTLTPTPVPTPTPTTKQWLTPLWSKLDIAWDNQAWTEVIGLLEQIRSLEPGNVDAEEKLFAAHFNFAMQLVEQGQLEQAVAHFDQALLLRPEYSPAQEARAMAVVYLKGLESYNQGNWTEAIGSLEQVYQKDAGYQEVRSLLYEAHWRQGAALQESGQLNEALEEYRRALDVWPGGTEAMNRRAAVAALLKRIEVDVSAQRLMAWEGDRLVYKFVCSTGKSGTPTKYGRFSVISKMPKAYGSAWDIWMPYWLGVYWAGGSENGIHGLPILSSGQTLWSGYLGQPISYGCIVLDTWAAKQLYDWAEIGTEVIIHE